MLPQDPFFNRHQLEDATWRAQDKASQVEHQMRTLAARFERLVLVTQTLWELLREQTDLTQQQMYDKMQEIDLRDGVADGKIGKKVFECTNCGHTVAGTYSTCIYCGEPRPEQEPSYGPGSETGGSAAT
jgi:rubrerythrin